jgi:hypothetical protein
MELKLLFLIPLFGFLTQLYNYAISREAVERQKVCRASGIILFSVGTVTLINRSMLSVFTGLIMMMFGFRLIANGLDRLDKKIFLDSYKPDIPIDEKKK